MSRFRSLPGDELPIRRLTLGPCECPGTPHETDWVDVAEVITWDALVDVGLAASEGAARLALVTRAIRAWNLVDEDGETIEVVEEAVRLLDPATLTPIAEVVNEAYERASAPLPNGRSAPSARSQPESAPSSPTTPMPGRRGRSR